MCAGLCVFLYCLYIIFLMCVRCKEVCYLDAAADCDHRRLSGRGGDGEGAHLVVKAIVVSVVNYKVEDVGDRLAARL